MRKNKCKLNLEKAIKKILKDYKKCINENNKKENNKNKKNNEGGIINNEIGNSVSESFIIDALTRDGLNGDDITDFLNNIPTAKDYMKIGKMHLPH